jgi:hypothetical protein
MMILELNNFKCLMFHFSFTLDFALFPNVQTRKKKTAMNYIVLTIELEVEFHVGEVCNNI